jgi:hypothetical protein
MARLQVTCINKQPSHYARHERIRAIGGSWGKHTQDDAIRNIESGIHSYYTIGGGSTANVIVAVHLGRKYLKTDADTTTRDNLLSLPECS